SSSPPPHPDLHSFPTRRSSDLSYENCRVYTNSSHFGTLSTEPLQGTTPVRAAFARSASLRYPFPLFASQLSTLNYQSKIPSGSGDRKSTRLNSSHQIISYAVFC